MADYVHLLGSEDVRSAASSMRDSAQQIRQAAGSFDAAVFSLRQVLDDALLRLEALLKEATKAEQEAQADGS